jgi:hypothetical protein
MTRSAPVIAETGNTLAIVRWSIVARFESPPSLRGFGLRLPKSRPTPLRSLDDPLPALGTQSPFRLLGDSLSRFGRPSGLPSDARPSLALRFRHPSPGGRTHFPAFSLKRSRRGCGLRSPAVHHLPELGNPQANVILLSLEPFDGGDGPMCPVRRKCLSAVRPVPVLFVATPQVQRANTPRDQPDDSGP